MTLATIPWKPLGGALGAEVSGCDVAGLPGGALLELVHHRQVVVIRGQSLDPAALQAVAAGLGELEVYRFADALPGTPHVVPVIKNPEDTANFGGDWHSDSTYLERPPALTVLYAVQVPPRGGDTLFADMWGAHDALSPAFRRLLESLEGCNTASLVHGDEALYGAVAGPARQSIRVEAPLEAIHPVVRVHPVTGRRGIYLNRVHTERFRGMTREESLPLIDFLQAFVVREQHLSRVRWEPGTLTIWDNRSVQHLPLNDYPGQRREMHRVIVRGERPLGPGDVACTD